MSHRAIRPQRAALVFLAAVALVAGCSEATAPTRLERHWLPTASVPNPSISASIEVPGPCTIASYMCGGLWVDPPTSGYWTVSANIQYIQDNPYVTGQLSLAGESNIRRGGSLIPDEIDFLGCHEFNARSCGDLNEFASTCSKETNDVDGEAVVEGYKNGLLYTRDFDDHGHCDPRPQDDCNLQYEDDPTYDPGASADCSGDPSSGGGGGGGGGYTDCDEAYVTVEISYDGGNTWSVWWEGWAEVCG